MKTRFSFFIFSLFVSTIGCGQHIKDKKADLFKQEVNNFRFDLYKELDKISYEDLINYNFDNEDSLITAIDNFCSSHEKEIINYRLSRLNQFSNNPVPDFKNYEKNPGIGTDIIFHNKDFQESMPFTKLLFIDPFQYITIINNYIIASNSSVQALAAYNIKNMIANPLISTRKISSVQWEIIINTYNQINKFTYDYTRGEIINIEVFKLKNEITS